MQDHSDAESEELETLVWKSRAPKSNQSQEEFPKMEKYPVDVKSDDSDEYADSEEFDNTLQNLRKQLDVKSHNQNQAVDDIDFDDSQTHKPGK